MAARAQTFRLPQIQEYRFRDFSGGLNLRDAPTELGRTETPDCENVTLDERGGIVKRLGLTRVGSGTVLTAAAQNLFYWATGAVTIVQVGAVVYSTTDFVTFTALRTFTTTARVTFVDFQYKLVAVHPVDGVWVSTGGAFTQTTGGTANMEAVKGTCIASWQNKVWVGGDPVNKSRVWFSDAGDASKWTVATSWVDVREKDDLSVTALGIGQGMDISGRPGLLVFKDESTYRINNSTSGAYTTLDSRVGAAGPLAVVTTGGLTGVISRHGIYLTDGVTGMKNVSQQIEPLFTPGQINFAQLDKMCAGIHRERMVFSLPAAGSSVNTRTLELHPHVGWIVPHSFGASAFAMYSQQDQKLYAASPTLARVYETFKGGTDDGTAIASRYQTHWFEPNGGNDARLPELRITGRGTFTVYRKANYETGQGTSRAAAINTGAFVWNDPATIWNSPGMIWGPGRQQNALALPDLGVVWAVSFVISETSSVSATGQQILSTGTAPEVGAWAVYGLDLFHIPLGSF